MFQSLLPKSRRLALVLMSSGMFLAPALAEEPPPAGQPYVVDPYRESGAAKNTAQPPASAGALTAQQVGALLGNMGFEPTAVKNEHGGYFYKLHFDRNGWTMSLNVSVSLDHTVVWITAPLTAIPDTTKVSPQALLKLMEQSSARGPAYFSFRPDCNNRVYLSLPIPNKGLTAATLRASIDGICETIQQTEPFWSEKALFAPTENGFAQNQ